MRALLNVGDLETFERLLRPYHRNFNKRLVKSPKLYLVDTGLACHLVITGCSRRCTSGATGTS